MPSALIINGRRYVDIRTKELSTEELPHPIGYLSVRDPNWTDGPWKLRYRHIDRKLEHEHWLTMPEILELTKRKEPWVVQQVRDGKLDTAMVKGSTIPLFRILDRAGIIRETILETPPKEKEELKLKRPSRRWDKE